MFGKKKAKTEDAVSDPGAEAPEGDAAAGTEGEASPAKKGLPKMVLIAAAAAVVVVGGGGTTAFLLLGKGGAPHAAKPAKKPEKKDDKKGADGKKDPNAPVVADGPNGVVYYTLPDLVVNMQTADGRPSFLKLKLTLELPDHDTADALDPNLPRLQDMFQVFLRELRPEDLAGSEGGYQLRMEILRRVNLVIAPSKANAVLIEEMLVN
jgi:flagellar FliL protein